MSDEFLAGLKRRAETCRQAMKALAESVINVTLPPMFTGVPVHTWASETASVIRDLVEALALSRQQGMEEEREACAILADAYEARMTAAMNKHEAAGKLGASSICASKSDAGNSIAAAIRSRANDTGKGDGT